MTDDRLTEATGQALLQAITALSEQLRPRASNRRRQAEAPAVDIDHPLIDAAFDHINARDRISHRELQRALGTRWTSATLTAACQRLVDEGRIVIETEKPPGGGRETRFYVMTTA